MCEKLAFSPMRGTSAPMQLGPSRRITRGRAASSMACFCSALRPAVSTMAARVPRSASCATRPGTVAGGVQRTANSGTCGSAATSLNTGTPSSVSSRGFTGHSAPLKSCFRLRQTVAPTLAGRSDAPSTTTLAGSNRESRFRMLMA